MNTDIQTLPSTQIAEATPDHINQQIERETEARINQFKREEPEAIKQRIAELDNERDTEQVLKITMAGIALSASLLTLTANKKWALLGGTASAFMLQQALLGWSPPLYLIRLQGIRTASEINLEKQALKNLLKDEHYPV